MATLWQYYYPCGLALRIKIQKNILTWSMQAGLISAKNKKNTKLPLMVRDILHLKESHNSDSHLKETNIWQDS